MTELAQFYIDRFNDSIKASESKVETELVISSLDNVRKLQKLQMETSSKELDTAVFFENSLKMLEDRIDKMKPETYLRSFDKFEEPKLKNRYVQSILKAMRENKFDVRRLNFGSLTSVIMMVAHYQRADLHVFFKYLLSCLEAQYYPRKVLQENFSQLSSLFYLFVKEGFITPDQPSRFYFTYLLTLKEKLETGGVVQYSDLINVLWALITAEEESLHNPIIPRLYERLHEFKRADKPLSKEEMLELY